MILFLMSDQIKSCICQITIHKFNYSLSEDRGCLLNNNLLLFFLFLLTTQTHATARILTQWSLLLMFRVSPEPRMSVCGSFSVHCGWFLIYPFKLSPKPASCPLCDPSSSSLLSSSLSLLSSSVSHWGEPLMLFDREQNVFRTLCLSFF